MTESRTPLHRAIDLTDQALVELFQANGVITDPEGTVYTQNALLNIARTAYWLGLGARTRDAERTERLSVELRQVVQPAETSTR